MGRDFKINKQTNNDRFIDQNLPKERKIKRDTNGNCQGKNKDTKVSKKVTVQLVSNTYDKKYVRQMLVVILLIGQKFADALVQQVLCREKVHQKVT